MSTITQRHGRASNNPYLGKHDFLSTPRSKKEAMMLLKHGDHLLQEELNWKSPKP